MIGLTELNHPDRESKGAEFRVHRKKTKLGTGLRHDSLTEGGKILDSYNPKQAILRRMERHRTTKLPL